MDQRELWIDHADACEELEAVEAWHADVAQDDAGEITIKDGESFFGRGEGRRLETCELQRLPAGEANHVVVVDDDDAVGSHAITSALAATKETSNTVSPGWLSARTEGRTKFARDLRGYGKPEAEALSVGFGGEERVENLLAQLHRNASAIVTDAEDDLVGPVLGTDEDHAVVAFGHRIEGIQQKVQDDLLETKRLEHNAVIG